MAKDKLAFFDKPGFRLVLTTVSIVLAAAILAFSALTIVEITKSSYDQAPKFLIWIFIFSGLMSVVLFFKNRNRINLYKCAIILTFNVILGIVVLFAKNNPFLFSLTAGLYCVNLIIGSVFDIIRLKTKRAIIMNVLIITFAIVMAIGMLVSPIKEVEQIQNIILIECIFIAVVSSIGAASIAFSQLKFKVLFKVIVNTFSLEILFGLLTMIVCFSLVFMRIEDSIETFGEGLWYCFAIVTTIGFGDFTATTILGRILSVILGLYGIVAVAVITSIVVNFYNETSGRRDRREIKDIAEEDKNPK